MTKDELLNKTEAVLKEYQNESKNWIFQIKILALYQTAVI